MAKEKLNILFDATILVDGSVDSSSRTGIYFVAKNILNEMTLKNDVNVYLTACPSKLAGLKKIASRNCKILDKGSWLSNQVFSILFHIRLIKKKIFSMALIRKMFSLLELIIDNGYEKIYSRFLFAWPEELRELKNIVYFSPTADSSKHLRKNEIRRFVVLHDAIPFKLHEYKNQLNNKWVCYFLNKDVFYFTVSNSTKRDFCNIFPNIAPDHFQTVYLGAKESFCPKLDQMLIASVKAKYGIPSDKKFVFSLCTLEPRKNLIRAIRSFIKFSEKNSITDMIFVLGGPSWHDFEKKLVEDEEVKSLYSKYVKWIGYVADEELPVLYSNAEWFVYTSQYEGFGLPPLEAMKCGCPVIVSNNSSLPEVVGDAGIMIDWDNDEQHMAAYEQYYFNESLRKENGRKGVERAKWFSWKRTVDSIILSINSREGLL